MRSLEHSTCRNPPRQQWVQTQTSARKKIPAVATRAAYSRQFIFVHWTCGKISQTDSKDGSDPPSPPGQGGISVLSLQSHRAFPQHSSSSLCSFECCWLAKAGVEIAMPGLVPAWQIQLSTAEKFSSDRAKGSLAKLTKSTDIPTNYVSTIFPLLSDLFPVIPLTTPLFFSHFF